MSRAGNCYDNAVAESFFATLKRERIYRHSYRTRPEARADVFQYPEIFYNRQRRHSAVGHLSTERFEKAKERTPHHTGLAMVMKERRDLTSF